MASQFYKKYLQGTKSYGALLLLVPTWAWSRLRLRAASAKMATTTPMTSSDFKLNIAAVAVGAAAVDPGSVAAAVDLKSFGCAIDR